MAEDESDDSFGGITFDLLEEDIPEDAIFVDLARDPESRAWLDEEPDRRYLSERSDEELEELAGEARDRLTEIYIEDVTNYLLEELPEEHLERRGRPAIIAEAAVAVERADLDGYTRSQGGYAAAESILSDQNYSIAE